MLQARWIVAECNLLCSSAGSGWSVHRLHEKAEVVSNASLLMLNIAIHHADNVTFNDAIGIWFL
jgi:hypothetical protein